MSMYNLIEHSDNYSKTSGSLCQYYRVGPAFTNARANANFNDANNSGSFKLKQKIMSKTAAAMVEIFKYKKYYIHYTYIKIFK